MSQIQILKIFKDQFITFLDELIAQLEGYENYYIDAPEFIGVQGDIQFNYSIILESHLGEEICISEKSVIFPTGLVLLNENFNNW